MLPSHGACVTEARSFVAGQVELPRPARRARHDERRRRRAARERRHGPDDGPPRQPHPRRQRHRLRRRRRLRSAAQPRAPEHRAARRQMYPWLSSHSLGGATNRWRDRRTGTVECFAVGSASSFRERVMTV